MILYVLNTKTFTEQVTNNDKYIIGFLILITIFMIIPLIIIFVNYIENFILDKEYKEFKKMHKLEKRRNK